jgi:hypothetical protein
MLFDSRAGYSFRTGNTSATLLATLTSANGLTPGATATYNLGTTALRWNGLNCATVNASGASTLTGAVTCGSTLAATGAATLSGGLAVTGTSTLNGNVVPLTNLVGDLGSSGAYWNNGFIFAFNCYSFNGHAGAVSNTGNITPNATNAFTCGSSALRFSTVYTTNVDTTNAVVVSSDENAKTDIEDVPDAVLDAWAAVKYKRYRRKGAGDQRWHAGLVAQQIEAAFAAAGLDAAEWCLVNKDMTRDVGEQYTICPDECLFMEAALMRRAVLRLSGGPPA